MAVDQTAGNSWGVTVGEVSALAPQVSIGTTPAAPVDPVFGRNADRRISVDEVEQFISDVSGRVALRLTGLSRITDETRLTALGKAAHDATVNGAASYLVAAAHPAGQTNSDGGYAALLWSRYESALDGAFAALTGWLDVMAPIVPEPTGSISSFFPAPMFPDGGRF
jgi:hypothetical protein